MIEQIAQAISFDAFFTLDGAGATGLTVTIDVYRGATKVVDNVAATEVGGGFYTYALAGASNSEKNHYRAVFKTAGSVDQAHIPALWVVGSTWVENAADVNTRTARFDALIEDSDGDRFSAKALEMAPTGEVGVGGSGASSPMLFSVNFGTPQTGVGYQFVSSSGLIGSRVTADIVQIGTGGLYQVYVIPPETARAIYWNSTDNAYVIGVENFEQRLINNLTTADIRTELAAELADITALNDIEVEGYTTQQALTLILAAIAAQSTGFGTNTVVFRNIANDKARITATVDAEGNRTAITLDPD